MSSKPAQIHSLERVATRRNVVRGAAWTTAAVTVVVATPNIAAASGGATGTAGATSAIRKGNTLEFTAGLTAGPAALSNVVATVTLTFAVSGPTVNSASIASKSGWSATGTSAVTATFSLASLAANTPIASENRAMRNNGHALPPVQPSNGLLRVDGSNCKHGIPTHARQGVPANSNSRSVRAGCIAPKWRRQCLMSCRSRSGAARKTLPTTRCVSYGSIRRRCCQSNDAWHGPAVSVVRSKMDWKRLLEYSLARLSAFLQLCLHRSCQGLPQLRRLGGEGIDSQRRAERCEEEYREIQKAFNLRIMPYVDPDLLVGVRFKSALKWAPNTQND